MELTELMSLIASVFDELSIPYYITGSCASISYGEPRLTNDIDIVADLKMKDVKALNLMIVSLSVERQCPFRITKRHPSPRLKMLFS